MKKEKKMENRNLYHLFVIKNSIENANDKDLYDILKKSIKHLYRIDSDIKSSFLQMIEKIQI